LPVVVGALAASAIFGLLGCRHHAGNEDGSARTDAVVESQPAAITIHYPADGTIFPPDFAPPTFLWRDAATGVTQWRIDVVPADGSTPLHAESPGEPCRIGEIDPRCVATTNQLPTLTPEEADARTWTPDAATWAAIKQHSVSGGATVTIRGFSGREGKQVISRGRVTIHTSKDPVGAPIFYRDVPLMPAQLQKGVIQPLAKTAIPLIAWRLRDVGRTQSRLLLSGLHTCTNCHSFSGDGRTMGMDVNGPRDDKGTYAMVPVRAEMSIRPEDIMTWNAFAGKPRGHRTRGFMPQVSPDGRYAVATLNEAIYVVNFKDYRALQVFYPTRGILGYYDRRTGAIKALPGADDPRYVHTGAVWSPDGKYLVFSRAEAKDPYPAEQKLPQFAGDSNELPMQYDLCRIPFNDGRGGRAEPIDGASHNGMSNNFAKVSPDGRWIVFVECRNGLLMRPDGKLYVVPAEGGQARSLACNTPRMNSWHSFSPNGRWLVFSSKSRSPYTQMFLTHLDEECNASPPILIENATAANRAVNIPEFVNTAAEGLNLLKIDVPAAEVYRLFDLGEEKMGQGRREEAVATFRQALEVDPEYLPAHLSMAFALAAGGQSDEAIAHYRKALEIEPDREEAHVDLGVLLAGRGQFDEAVAEYQAALKVRPDCAEAYNNLGVLLLGRSRLDEAIADFGKAVTIDPDYAEAHSNLGFALGIAGRVDEAVGHCRKALELKPDYSEAHNNLGMALAAGGRLDEAITHYRKALEINRNYPRAELNMADAMAARGQSEEAIAHYRKALQLTPDDAVCHNKLGMVLAGRGQYDEAIAHYAKALELKPDYAWAHNNLGTALVVGRKRFDEAIAHFQKALKIKPDYVGARQNLERAQALKSGK
jgi:tetratricopeptide (TPR) repeat protein